MKSSIGWLLALAGCAVAAQPAERTDAGDPLRSAECMQALDSLQAQEAAAASPRASGAADGRAQRPADAALQASRRRAASACLASRPDVPPPPGRMAEPPVAVPPIAPPPAAVPRPAAPVSRIEPPGPLLKPADKPTFITTCDDTGCWANDGSRLNRTGPNLWGSRGVCTVQGVFVNCP